jgi:hypothetical protein
MFIGRPRRIRREGRVPKKNQPGFETSANDCYCCPANRNEKLWAIQKQLASVSATQENSEKPGFSGIPVF